MLPTPHGPTDASPTEGPAAVTEGGTPDTGALLRVVEHLAEVPDDAEDTQRPRPASSDRAEAGADAATAAEDVPTRDVDVAPAAAAPAADGGPTVGDDDASGDGEPATPDDGSDVAAADDAGDADDEPTADEPTDDAHTDDEPTDDAHTADEPADTEPTEPTEATEAAQAQPGDAAPAADAGPVTPVSPVGPVAAALSDTRHRIDELNPAERLFLGQQRALVAELCHDPFDADAVGALFDRVHEQWTQADDRPDPRPLADAFGVALGDLVCAEAPDLGWATCSDRFGTEIVLAREDPEVLVYPIASVARDWPTAGPGWFVAHLATVVRGVRPDGAPHDA